jgi:hypothetical protein
MELSNHAIANDAAWRQILGKTQQAFKRVWGNNALAIF